MIRPTAPSPIRTGRKSNCALTIDNEDRGGTRAPRSSFHSSHRGDAENAEKNSIHEGHEGARRGLKKEDGGKRTARGILRHPYSLPLCPFVFFVDQSSLRDLRVSAVNPPGL